ncbi:MAG TPA: hypothetical protein VIK98_07995 [Limnochordales bacterium]
MIRTAVMRTAVLTALWLALARQVPAVTEGGILREPAQRVLAALGGDPERVLIVAAATRRAPDGVAMADLKREAQGVARRLERLYGVEGWRLDNGVETGGHLVFLDGRTRTGGQLRVVAWFAGGHRGTVAALVQPGEMASAAAARRGLVREVARALGLRPSALDSAVEVAGFVAGKAGADVEAELARNSAGRRRSGGELPVALEASTSGSRVVIGSVAVGPAELDVLGDVVW